MTRTYRKDRDNSQLRGPSVRSMDDTQQLPDPEQWFDEDQPGEIDPTSTTAVAEEVVPETVVRPTRETEAEKTKPKRQPRYHVILWNDEDHSFEYVIRMLKELFGHPNEQGMQLAGEVDVRGKAIVMTTTLERAELKRDQIHAYGKDASIKSCKGSMSSSIEPELV